MTQVNGVYLTQNSDLGGGVPCFSFLKNVASGNEPTTLYLYNTIEWLSLGHLSFFILEREEGEIERQRREMSGPLHYPRAAFPMMLPCGSQPPADKAQTLLGDF